MLLRLAASGVGRSDISYDWVGESWRDSGAREQRFHLVPERHCLLRAALRDGKSTDGRTEHDRIRKGLTFGESDSQTSSKGIAGGY